MTFEIKRDKPRAIDFTFDGKKLAVRGLSLYMGLKLQGVSDGDMIPAEIVAEFISSCVVYEDGGNVWSPDEVLDMDATSMMTLFSEVSGISVSAEEAAKN